MRRVVFALSSLVLGGCVSYTENLQTSGVAQGSDGTIVRNIWANVPNYADIRGVYPPFAARTGVSGSATLICTVGAEGFLRNCGVLDGSETPQGYGFGVAALRLGSKFRVNLAPGGPSVGQVVRTPVVFRSEP